MKRLLWTGLSVGAAVWLWNWLSVDETGNPVSVKSDEPSVQIKNLESFLVRRDGLPLWEISAQNVSVAADGLTTTATRIGRGILYRDGKPFLNLAAPRLRFFRTTNDLEASGGVTATGPNGFGFQTPRALWKNREKTVACPQPVKAQLRGLHFATPNLSYDWDKGVLNCPQSVEVIGRGVVLRGQKLGATLKTRQVRLEGGVEMIFEPKTADISLPR
ncbi:MAG: LPS export ABC transporter periplasmic protein LptC [Armatimonadetes bacterium]|nr:LPS export ABC transporter periplasmic protein LptC [Armatimonadota bacterium]